MKRVLLAAVPVASVLGFVMLFVSSPSTADDRKGESNRGKGPDATWSVPRVDATIKPGETKTVQVTLQALDHLDAGVVRIVPALAPYVHVTPTTTPELSRGQLQNFTITFSAKIDALPTTTDGVIQLREKKEKKRTGENLVRPLAICVDVAWEKVQDVATGLSFSFPAFGTSSSITNGPVDFGSAGKATIYNVQLGTDRILSTTRYQVMIIRGFTASSLVEWFIANIDPSSLLLSSGAFTQRTLADGTTLLVRTGEVPDAYSADNGPVSGLFGMLPDGITIVSVQTSNDDRMREDFGIGDAALQSQYIDLVASF